MRFAMSQDDIRRIESRRSEDVRPVVFPPFDFEMEDVKFRETDRVREFGQSDNETT